MGATLYQTSQSFEVVYGWSSLFLQRITHPRSKRQFCCTSIGPDCTRTTIELQPHVGRYINGCDVIEDGADFDLQLSCVISTTIVVCSQLQHLHGITPTFCHTPKLNPAPWRRVPEVQTLHLCRKHPQMKTSAKVSTRS